MSFSCCMPLSFVENSSEPVGPGWPHFSYRFRCRTRTLSLSSLLFYAPDKKVSLISRCITENRWPWIRVGVGRRESVPNKSGTLLGNYRNYRGRAAARLFSEQSGRLWMVQLLKVNYSWLVVASKSSSVEFYLSYVCLSMFKQSHGSSNNLDYLCDDQIYRNLRTSGIKNDGQKLFVFFVNLKAISPNINAL